MKREAGVRNGNTTGKARPAKLFLFPFDFTLDARHLRFNGRQFLVQLPLLFLKLLDLAFDVSEFLRLCVGERVLDLLSQRPRYLGGFPLPLMSCFLRFL